MRPVHEITAKEECFRFEKHGSGAFVKRDPVEPEPVGTIILSAFRITGYDQDCDGSLMARLEQIDNAGELTGWTQTCIGLYPSTNLVMSLDEWKRMFAAQSGEGG